MLLRGNNKHNSISSVSIYIGIIESEKKMSKRKRNIAYIKPEEPKFLRELKLQAGFKEGPTIDTKHEDLPEADDDDRDDMDEEEPVIVVLKDGDLTAEEADAIKKQKEEEEANAKADLTKRIIFKKNKAETVVDDSAATKKTKKIKQKKVPLSFNDDEEDE